MALFVDFNLSDSKSELIFHIAKLIWSFGNTANIYLHEYLSSQHLYVSWKPLHLYRSLLIPILKL